MTDKQINKWLIPLLLFFGIVSYFMIKLQHQSVQENVSFEDELDVQITNMSNNRGIQRMNNGDIKLTGRYPVINYKDLKYKIPRHIKPVYPKNKKTDSESYEPTLADVRPPFRLTKKAYSDTLKIIKNSDTIIVTMKI